jgi:hypothetical protein
MHQKHYGCVFRIFWLVAFIASVIIAGFLIYEIWMNYYNSPIIVSFQPFETPIDIIPFPAVTSEYTQKYLVINILIYRH